MKNAGGSSDRLIGAGIVSLPFRFLGRYKSEYYKMIDR